MSRLRRGYNPCIIEGCEEMGSGPKGTVVCSECRRKIKDYDKLRDRGLEGRVSIVLPTYPYIPGRSLAGHDSARTGLDKLLRELRDTLPQPARPEHRWYTTAPGEKAPEFEGKPRFKYVISRDGGTIFNVPEPLAQFLVDIEPAIQQAVKEAEEDGKLQGTNLLAQLAAGNLTSDEFEKKAGIQR